MFVPIQCKDFWKPEEDEMDKVLGVQSGCQFKNWATNTRMAKHTRRKSIDVRIIYSWFTSSILIGLPGMYRFSLVCWFTLYVQMSLVIGLPGMYRFCMCWFTFSVKVVFVIGLPLAYALCM
jgi:hypothetical protein